MKGFRPFGLPLCKIGSVQLTFEEYETIRLINYEMLDQEQAAEQMNVSRPTLTRIYNKALKTISQAFVEGKAIVIEGGDYELENEWFRCRKCHKLIEGLENHMKCENCNMFGSDELILLNQNVKD
jgi:predicted DNA-binding protein (UPF0251 family)